MDASKLTEEERRTLEAIEIYRAEHTTWNLDRLEKLFSDYPTIWRGQDEHTGKEAVKKLIGKWASNAKHTVMSHQRVVVQGNRAAVEWTTVGTAADGSPMDMAGANVYELENGKIKYLAIYRRR
jgi:ketosteroid isomerase-like protein